MDNKLNSLVRDGVIDIVTAFNILAEMSSGPVDLEIKLNILSSLHRKSTGQFIIIVGHSEDG